VVNATILPLYTQERNSVPIFLVTRWAPGAVWTNVGKIYPIGIQPPDRPARIEDAISLDLRRQP